GRSVTCACCRRSAAGRNLLPDRMRKQAAIKLPATSVDRYGKVESCSPVLHLRQELWQSCADRRHRTLYTSLTQWLRGVRALGSCTGRGHSVASSAYDAHQKNE